MGLKILRLKLKGIRLKRFLIGSGRKKGRKGENGKRAPWMKHVSHGYHVVELDEPWRHDNGVRDQFDDSVVVQREQAQECELWFFGVFDHNGLGEAVSKYMQSHFFDKMPKQSRMAKKSKEAMKGAHVNARSKLRDINQDEGRARQMGSASAMVINGEKLVMANAGDYRAVVCRDGEAFDICGKKQHPTKPRCSLKFISGAFGAPKLHKKVGHSKSSELVAKSERIDSETEFVILASAGVWEVMKHQEAVNLIRHIEAPQAAAECLATEALIRMTKSNVSCLIIRFD